MAPFSVLIPHTDALLGAGCVLTSAAAMTGLGRLITPRVIPEIGLIVGWGAVCTILTLWGCLTSVTLAVPTVALGLLGIVGWFVPRSTTPGAGGLWRVAVLSVPIWIVMLPVGPSQVDTWLNLLPNAAYLTDHGVFPRWDRPESYSFIPVAPYNTQFVSYAASLLRGGLIANAMGLFNILLQCAAGGILARVLSGKDRRLTWGSAGLGLLLAIPLNLGFVPKVFFSGYGEAPLAVTAMAAVWLGGAWLSNVHEGEGEALRCETLIALSMVLAAMINIKQSAIGLAFAFEFTALAILVADRRRARLLPSYVLHIIPAALLYGVWRWYATSSFPAGELKALPISQWNIGLIPEILRGVAIAIAQKGVYFLAIMLLFVGTAVAGLRRKNATAITILMLGCGTIFIDNGFIIFTYVAHFEPSWAVQAHSYFRYMTQLSLIVTLGLTILALGLIRPWMDARSDVLQRRASACACAAIVILPFVALPFLRFDLEAPQPQLSQILNAVKPFLPPHQPLAIWVPDDGDDIAGSYVRGLLLFTSPRLIPSNITTGTMPLANLERSGVRRVLISCASHFTDLAGIPQNAMVLMSWRGGKWIVTAAWPYPAGFGAHHWAGLLPKESFCGGLS